MTNLQVFHSLSLSYCLIKKQYILYEPTVDVSKLLIGS